MTPSTIKVMVTGAGSGVGQGIVKALRLSTLDIHVLTADIALQNQALYRGDSAMLIPKAEDADALERMIICIREAHPHVLFIGSEFEIEFFSKHRAEIEEETGVRVCVAAPETITIANDKWLTVEHLRRHKLPHAKSFVPASLSDALEAAGKLGFPCVLKTRRGTSNRHVHILEDTDQLRAAWPTVPSPVVQELLAQPSNQLSAEYTCSVFRCADGHLLGPFTARRTLRGGNSWCVEVDHFKDIANILIPIAESLDFQGSLNIQLMLTEHGPVPFELNARSSGTTAVRAYYGFNEPEMYLKSYLLGESIHEVTIRKGMAFRYLEEVFVDDYGISEIDENAIPQGRVLPWF